MNTRIITSTEELIEMANRLFISSGELAIQADILRTRGTYPFIGSNLDHAFSVDNSLCDENEKQ